MTNVSDKIPRRLPRACRLLLAMIVVSAAVAPASSVAQEKLAQNAYHLQPGDVLLITVYEEDDLNREVLIRPDGGISFPLIGDIEVAGLSVAQVRATLEERLDHYVPGARVTVITSQIAGNRVFVVGKVNRPGSYALFRPLDVMQALALAGGAAQFAALEDIRILRRDAEGQQRVFQFNYSDIVAGRNLDQNILLEGGDTVVVP